MAQKNRFEIVQGPSRWDVLLESVINRERRHTIRIKRDKINVEISIAIHGVIWNIPNLSALTADGSILADSEAENILMLWGHTHATGIVEDLRPNRTHCHFIAFYDVQQRVGQITFLTQPYQIVVPTLTEPPLVLDGFFCAEESSAHFCRFPDQVIYEYKQAIIASPDAGDFCKQTLLWLIEKSEKFTKPVAISFAHNLDEGTQTAFGQHDMVSANCKTRLDRIEKALDIPMTFSNHGGLFNDENDFLSGDRGYTLWLSPVKYDRNVKIFYDTQTVMAEIRAIKLIG